MMQTLYEKLDFVQLSEKYAGRWVALDPDSGAVLAVGSSLKEVREAVTSSPVVDPIIAKVEEYYGAFVP